MALPLAQSVVWISVKARLISTARCCHHELRYTHVQFGIAGSEPLLRRAASCGTALKRVLTAVTWKLRVLPQYPPSGDVIGGSSNPSARNLALWRFDVPLPDRCIPLRRTASPGRYRRRYSRFLLRLCRRARIRCLRHDPLLGAAGSLCLNCTRFHQAKTFREMLEGPGIVLQFPTIEQSHFAS